MVITHAPRVEILYIFSARPLLKRTNVKQSYHCCIVFSSNGPLPVNEITVNYHLSLVLTEVLFLDLFLETS